MKPVVSGTLMLDIKFLWRNRERPRNPRRWAKVWLKRLYHLFATARLLLRASNLRSHGAQLGPISIVGDALLGGNRSNLSIGEGSTLGRCEVSLHDRVIIGSRVVINDGVVLLTGSHSLSDPEWTLKTSPIEISDYAWIAANAIILPGVVIGIGSVVGAGAVVRESVPDFAIAIGNPARLLDGHRVSSLNYLPAAMIAPFEAWLGRYPNRPDDSRT